VVDAAACFPLYCTGSGTGGADVLTPELRRIFAAWGHPVDEAAAARFLAGYADPAAAAREMVAFAQAGAAGELGIPFDPAAFLADTFLARNLPLLTDRAGAALLRFPPGSPVYAVAARTAPTLVAVQLEAAFPGLAEVLPRLCPTLSAPVNLAGAVADVAWEDVKTGVMGATTGAFHVRLGGAAAGQRLVLKQMDMAVERVLAAMVAEVFELPAVDILWTGSAWSAMRPVAGRSLRDISGNPLTEPRRKLWGPAAVMRVAEELGRESALAWSCRLFGRHSGNLIATHPDDLAEGGYVRIDFGQSLLPSRNRYLEAVMPLWHLRRFFPAEGTGGYEEPPVCAAVARGFTGIAATARRARAAVARHLAAAVGLPLPEMDGEAPDPRVTPAHVAAVVAELEAGPEPAAAFNELYSRFYQGFWQVHGWQEHLPPADHRQELSADEFHGLLPERTWIEEQG